MGAFAPSLGIHHLVWCYPSLTFTYDRPTAAKYAIEHSWDYNGNPNLPAQHVTRRIAGTVIPFADFPYSYLSSTPGATGSALFVSESIWAGGLPMTVGDPLSCQTSPNPNISEGWRYCRNLVGASNPWDFHQQLLAYYTHTQVPGFNYPNNILPTNNFGNQLSFLGCGTVQTNRIASGNPRGGNPPPPINPAEQDLDPYIPNDRDGIVTNASSLSAFIQSVLGCNSQQLLQGDYI